MNSLSQIFHVDGVIGPFKVSEDMNLRPTFRARNDNTNPYHWTIVINQHTQAVLEHTINAVKGDLLGVSPQDAVTILHKAIDHCRPRLTDQYNVHGYDLLSVELSVPSCGFSIHSHEESPHYIALSKHDMTFWHTHDPNMAPEAALHSHDVTLSIGIGNDAKPYEGLVELSEDMHQRLGAVAADYFAESQNFTDVTMELAAENLFEDILQSVPALKRGEANDYLKSIGICVIYDGSLDHPDYPVEFVRTLAHS